MSRAIKPKDRDTLIQALKAGVVPRAGIQHIAVGRSKETEALIRDIDRIADGGSAVRFVIGQYGSGKTFFLNLVKQIAFEKKLVVSTADLSPERRIHATGGQARDLYKALMSNLSTRSKPDGNALQSIVEKFISSAIQDANEDDREVEEIIHEKLKSLQDYVSGFDFVTVLTAYWHGYDQGDDNKKSSALRWLRGEYTTKTEARQDLGVRTIIEDASFYDHLKLMARFINLAGYDGYLVCLDEMVNIYKLNHAQARASNYEQLLRIINDSLQGACSHIGFVFGGTPDFLMDTRRGVYSYEALQTRLAENQFARDNVVDFSGPVIRLQALTPEELYVLLNNIRNIYASGDLENYPVPEEAIPSLMEHCQKKIGEAYFRTPRSIIRAFLDLLSIVEHNPNTSWKDYIESIVVEQDIDPELNAAPLEEDDDDELANIRI